MAGRRRKSAAAKVLTDDNLATIEAAVAMIGVQLFFTYAPLMHATFHTASIDLGAWLRVAAVSALFFAIVEVEKWLRRSNANGGPAALT